MKRVLVVSDLHCGHRSGLTPPSWQYTEGDDEKRNQYLKQQKILWDFFLESVEVLKPIDIVIANGDLIDGRGEKSGGTELIEPDRKQQAEMAATCLRKTEASKYYLTFGTSYHGGKQEDFEEITADLLGAEGIDGHIWVDVNGLVFDCKHKVGSSSIPHGRFTALAKEQLWNELWSAENGQTRADVIIRSHVHYHVSASAPGKLMVITPALQGFGSKYGVRQCSGVVNIGVTYFDIEDKEHYTWGTKILNMALIKPAVLKA